MSLIQAGTPAPFDYTAYDGATNLDVAAEIWDVTGTPTQIGFVIMPHVSGGMYVGSFTGDTGKRYAVKTAVYTDGTFTVLDTNRPPGSDSFQCFSIPLFTQLQALVASLAQSTQIINASLEGLEAETSCTDIEVEIEC